MSDCLSFSSSLTASRRSCYAWKIEACSSVYDLIFDQPWKGNKNLAGEGRNNAVTLIFHSLPPSATKYEEKEINDGRWWEGDGWAVKVNRQLQEISYFPFSGGPCILSSNRSLPGGWMEEEARISRAATLHSLSLLPTAFSLWPVDEGIRNEGPNIICRLLFHGLLRLLVFFQAFYHHCRREVV